MSSLEEFMSRHKDNPDFMNIISALSGEYVNHGNASIEKNKNLKHKVSGNVKQMHAKVSHRGKLIIADVMDYSHEIGGHHPAQSSGNRVETRSYND